MSDNVDIEISFGMILTSLMINTPEDECYNWCNADFIQQIKDLCIDEKTTKNVQKIIFNAFENRNAEIINVLMKVHNTDAIKAVYDQEFNYSWIKKDFVGTLCDIDVFSEQESYVFSKALLFSDYKLTNTDVLALFNCTKYQKDLINSTISTNSTNSIVSTNQKTTESVWYPIIYSKTAFEENKSELKDLIMQTINSAAVVPFYSILTMLSYLYDQKININLTSEEARTIYDKIEELIMSEHHIRYCLAKDEFFDYCSKTTKLIIKNAIIYVAYPLNHRKIKHAKRLMKRWWNTTKRIQELLFIEDNYESDEGN